MQSLLLHHGYVAIALLAFLEACCAPIPSEVTFGFAGVLAHDGRLSLFGVIVLGTLCELVGSYVSYAVGRFGGRPLVQRVGRFVLVTSADLDRAERWLSGRGGYALVIGRILPVLRGPASLVAGIAEMPAGRFGVFGLIGTALYATAVTLIGYEVASTWHRVEHAFSLAGYALALILVGIVVGGVWHRLRSLRAEQAAGLERVGAGR